ncbi:hypothetical protein ACGYK6_08670 [Sulfitobacter sp. 1A15333]|uniref:hypothetical protein n=1 Tax=Sulfitobacter sp. 1A15333 TaxID=3368570 RepID=UPI003744E041
MEEYKIMRFEFLQDRISEKSPAELGSYIAAMKGDQAALLQTLALIAALKAYGKDEGNALLRGFGEVRSLQMTPEKNFNFAKDARPASVEQINEVLKKMKVISNHASELIEKRNSGMKLSSDEEELIAAVENDQNSGGVGIVI